MKSVVGSAATTALGPSPITSSTLKVAVHRSMEPDPYRAIPSSAFCTNPEVSDWSTRPAAADSMARALQNTLVAAWRESKKSSSEKTSLPHCSRMLWPRACRGQTVPDDQSLTMPGKYMTASTTALTRNTAALSKDAAIVPSSGRICSEGQSVNAPSATVVFWAWSGHWPSAGVRSCIVSTLSQCVWYSTKEPL